eukprot:3360795-Amphidinium_carterae.1
MLRQNLLQHGAFNKGRICLRSNLCTKAPLQVAGWASVQARCRSHNALLGLLRESLADRPDFSTRGHVHRMKMHQEESRCKALLSSQKHCTVLRTLRTGLTAREYPPGQAVQRFSIDLLLEQLFMFVISAEHT